MGAPNAGNNPPPSRQQAIGSWVFGSLILIFYMFVFLYGPKVLSDSQHQQLGILSALLAGLFAFFLTGSILTRGDGNVSATTRVAVQATGGLGLAVLVLLWWGRTVPSSSSVAKDIGEQIDSAARAAPALDTARRTGGIRTSASIRDLASKLAASDPKYRELTAFSNAVVPVEAVSRASAILNPRPSDANVGAATAMQSTFGAGLGPFRLGMTTEEVSHNLPRPFGNVEWSSLPVATEYHSAEVRYFWVTLAEFSPPTSPSSPLKSLAAFAPCWGGQSYLTFLFTAGKLTRISARLYPDCAQRNALLHDLAQSFAVSDFNDIGPVAFSVTLPTSTVQGVISRDAASLEVFIIGSPQL